MSSQPMNSALSYEYVRTSSVYAISGDRRPAGSSVGDRRPAELQRPRSPASGGMLEVEAFLKMISDT
jgi:hypothetical protein